MDYYNIDNLWQNELTEKLVKATLLKNKHKFNETRKLIEETIFLFIFKKDISKVENKHQYILSKYKIEEWDEMINKFVANLPEWNIMLEDWIFNVDKTLNNLARTKDIKYLKVKQRCNNNKYKDFRIRPILYFDKEFYGEDSIIETIHSSKGKTYDAVLLLLKARGKLTLNQLENAKINTEVVRTAYVAMTRPRKILIVASPKNKKQDYKKFNKDTWNIIQM